MPNLLNEGLRANDLKYLVSDTFMIDTYKSKMGEDRDVAVLSFRVKDRLPALDLMEFIERGYGYVLDADISSGEESDGKYSVFVELERNKKLPEHIEEIVSGLRKLTGIDEWRYRYHKEWKGKDYNLQNITEDIPLDPDSYDAFLHENKVDTVKEFLDQTMYDDIDMVENTVKLSKPFGVNINFEVKDFDNYKSILSRNNDAVQLDEQAQAETVFLNKVFGNYEIIKLGENFMLRKNDQALLIRLI